MAHRIVLLTTLGLLGACTDGRFWLDAAYSIEAQASDRLYDDLAPGVTYGVVLHVEKEGRQGNGAILGPVLALCVLEGERRFQSGILEYIEDGDGSSENITIVERSPWTTIDEDGSAEQAQGRARALDPSCTPARAFGVVVELPAISCGQEDALLQPIPRVTTGELVGRSDAVAFEPSCGIGAAAQAAEQVSGERAVVTFGEGLKPLE